MEHVYIRARILVTKVISVKEHTSLLVLLPSLGVAMTVT